MEVNLGERKVLQDRFDEVALGRIRPEAAATLVIRIDYQIPRLESVDQFSDRVLTLVDLYPEILVVIYVARPDHHGRLGGNSSPPRLAGAGRIGRRKRSERFERIALPAAAVG